MSRQAALLTRQIFAFSRVGKRVGSRAVSVGTAAGNGEDGKHLKIEARRAGLQCSASLQKTFWVPLWLKGNVDFSLIICHN